MNFQKLRIEIEPDPKFKDQQYVLNYHISSKNEEKMNLLVSNHKGNNIQ